MVFIPSSFGMSTSGCQKAGGLQDISATNKQQDRRRQLWFYELSFDYFHSSAFL